MDTRLDLYDMGRGYIKPVSKRRVGLYEMDYRLPEEVIISDIPFEYRNQDRVSKGSDEPLTTSMSDVFKKLGLLKTA